MSKAQASILLRLKTFVTLTASVATRWIRENKVSTGSGSDRDWSASVLACNKDVKGNRDGCAPVDPSADAAGTDFIKTMAKKRSNNPQSAIRNPQCLVAVLIGSKSDWDTMRAASETLAKFGVPHESHVMSAHRTPKLASEF